MTTTPNGAIRTAAPNMLQRRGFRRGLDAGSDTNFVPAVIQGLAFVFKFRSGSWSSYSTSFPQVSTAATPNNRNSGGIKTVRPVRSPTLGGTLQHHRLIECSACTS